MLNDLHSRDLIMRVMKGSSNYLRNQVRKNVANAALCLFLFGLIFFGASLETLQTMRLNLLEEAGFLISLAPLVAFYFYLHKYRIYNAGWSGEKQVSKLLSNKFSDDYFLINDLYLQNGGGDIDHIVLGPSGIFVLETKNWSGEISCRGDEWQRGGKPSFTGSPSLQVKRNASKIRRIVDVSPSLKPLGIHVEGIVVFTNKHAMLHLNNPSVPILKLSALTNHITTQRPSVTFGRQQVEEMAEEILRQKG